MHWHAFRQYRRSLAQRFDLVIDQTNTIPFFTPVWATVPATMFIHQLAREVWWYEAPFPVSLMGFLAEPLYLRLYRNSAVLTVSPSTKSDLRALGFIGAITLIPNGLEPIQEPAQPKEQTAAFIYVGRLAPSKRVDHLIKAIRLFRLDNNDGVLWIIGDGPDRYRRRLEALTRRLGVEHAVQFLGRIPASQKHIYMSRAHALLMSSVREGWGLAVTEANACGTPAIAYNVPGLRDSVTDGVNGILVEPDPEAMARAMRQIACNTALAGKLSSQAKLRSMQFSFEKSADLLATTLDGLAQKSNLAVQTPGAPQ